MKKIAFFIDRDGVINHNAKLHDYIKTWSEFRFYNNCFYGLKHLKDKKIMSILVSNQRGIARGMLSENTLNEIHNKMQSELKERGANFSAIKYCPHNYEDKCQCRKPNSGMILSAAKEFEIDLNNSFMIDDAKEGIEAGKKAGCSTILVLTGRGPKEFKSIDQWKYKPDYVTKDLSSAVSLGLKILKKKNLV
jgi:histidinol-phosphate phosphatase family protein